MSWIRQSAFARSFLLPLALLLWLSACHKWVQLQPPLQQAIAEEKPRTIRVTMQDGVQKELKEPRVSGDTLISRQTVGQQVEIPLEAVRTVEARKANTPATVALAVGATLGAILVFWASPVRATQTKSAARQSHS